MSKFAPNMLRLAQHIRKTLSIRISLMVVFVIAVLLSAALFVMFRYARKAVKEEALTKATQTLEAVVEQIDNILLSVEQGTGNMLSNVYFHLHEPDQMLLFAHKLVESNPHVMSCAIAFEPYFFKDRGEYFMAYVYRSESDSTLLEITDTPIINSERYGNIPYNEQEWYTKTMATEMPIWLGPFRNSKKGEVIISFCLPLFDQDGKKCGVFGVGLPIDELSDIVLSATPSPNSYATMLSRDGTFIVHPDSSKLQHKTVFAQLQNDANPTVRNAAESMLAGQTGYMRFHMNGQDNYIFYKPFRQNVVPGRATEELSWSVGIIYPEDDIFGEYNILLIYVLTIAIAGLLILLILCIWFTHRQLKPLQMLTKSAQSISQGHFDEPVPDSRQQDEIGRLQNHFQDMQQSLASHMESLKQLTSTLKERGEKLSIAYEKSKEADRIKTAFLHNMTDQMIEPVSRIAADVSALNENDRTLSNEETGKLVNEIQEQGKKVTELLNNLFKASEQKQESQNV